MFQILVAPERGQFSACELRTLIRMDQKAGPLLEPSDLSPPTKSFYQACDVSHHALVAI